MNQRAIYEALSGLVDDTCISSPDLRDLRARKGRIGYRQIEFLDYIVSSKRSTQFKMIWYFLFRFLRRHYMLTTVVSIYPVLALKLSMESTL